jgi:hypothetical protein
MYLWLGKLFQDATGGGTDDGDVGGYFSNLYSMVIHVDFGSADHGFGPAPDGVHHFTVLIPNQGYYDEAAGGILSIGFRATLNDGYLNGEEALGIDNILLSTKCSDPHTPDRLLEQEQISQDSPRLGNATSSATTRGTTVYFSQQQQEEEDHGMHKLRIVDSLGRMPLSSKPSLDNDKDTYYCTNADYPCEGDKVYVCHYSQKRGYATYCIPEPDSEILRFYQRDYCGPCRRNGTRPKSTTTTTSRDDDDHVSTSS